MAPKEDLAEFVIKNLIFIVLFCFFCFYVSNNILIPQIQTLQERKSDSQYARLQQTKAQEKTLAVRSKIQEIRQNNHGLLSTLLKGSMANQIHSLSKEFFSQSTVQEKDKKTQGAFVETTLELQTQSNGVKPVFDFISKLTESFPNLTLVLPFEIHKIDPLTNTLEVKLFITSVELKAS